MIFRLPVDLWTRFGVAATVAGTNRAALLRDFIRWYLRDDDAKIPPRPPA